MRNNPYTPGAGKLPPVLAGRDQLLRELSIGLSNVASSGRPHAQDVIVVGPRGVGKTVTLTTYGQIAAAAGFEVVNLQAVAGSSGLVESLLQRVASRVAANAGPWVRAKGAFDRIAGISFGVAGVSAQIATHEQSRGSSLLDPGTLAEALVELASEVKRDAPTGGLLITVDEMQVASAADLALLAATLHRLNVDYPPAAVVFAGTGLPHTPETLRSAGVTHPDRLFILEPLSVALRPDEARFAIIEPARRAGVNWHPDAATRVVQVSNCYPAHLQQLAHIVWNTAAGVSQITPQDVQDAVPQFETDLHRRTLGPRWDRMSDRQMEYLAAVALLGGQTTTPRLAIALGRPIRELSWIRQELLDEGDIYSAQRGHVALAVPIFAPYILTRYDEARATADLALLSLEQMSHNSASGSGTSQSRPSVAPDPHAALLNPGSPSTQAARETPDRDLDNSAAAERDQSAKRDDTDFNPA